MPKINRRDFLKLNAALAAGAALSGPSRVLSFASSEIVTKPNILIFVFDALSARNMSLYGYPRPTTPNLEKFAGRSSVYHRHYSAGNFTTPGTTSMLTGMYPWTHRAFNFRGMIERTLADRNLFHLLGSEYTRLAFTQNLWADILLSQFEADLNFHPACASYSWSNQSLLQPDDLPRDRRMAYYVFQDFLNLRVEASDQFPGSLLAASTDLTRALLAESTVGSTDYPRGRPTNYDFLYENPAVFAGMERLVRDLTVQSAPFLAYLHVWSPHSPYHARREFVGIFNDNLQLPPKARHPLAGNNLPEGSLREFRRQYDEYVADVDAEFGNLMSNLERSGALQNTMVIVTSDHGEFFERGEVDHGSALMYAPVTHIPLLISMPGQRSRVDIHSLTSNIDLLPTVLRIAGREIPGWVEGRPLPGFGASEDASRSIFPLVAKDNPAFGPLKHATFTLIKGSHELFFFTGYPGHPDRFELYNLEEDPDELHDLFGKDITAASRLKDELLEAVSTANRNYQTK